MFTMENALIVALSQACRFLRDPTLDPRVKQFLKRELGSELVSLENRKKIKLRLLQEVREYIRLGRKKYSCSLLAAGIRKRRSNHRLFNSKQGVNEGRVSLNYFH